MEKLALDTGDRVLAIVAHPDDEVLGCFGLLSKASLAGAVVQICIANDGKQGRLSVSQAHAARIGAELLTRHGEFSVRDLACSRAFVGTIDTWIRDFAPTLLVTHGEYAGDHQEHGVVGQAVTVAWLRFNRVSERRCRLFRMCPIPLGLGFEPNVACDIESVLQLKTDALDDMMAIGARWYLSSAINERFSADMALRVAGGSSASFVEVFDEELRVPQFPAR